MASTYSTSVRVELQESGSNPGTWGTVANENVFDLFDEAIAQYASIAIAGSTSLTVTNGTASSGATDQGRKALLILTGTPGAGFVLTLPEIQKGWIIYNNTDSTATVKTTTDTTNVVVEADRFCGVYADGAGNMYQTTVKINESGIVPLAEIENVGATTVSATQWGYLGELNQSLTTTANVTHADLNATGDTTVGGTLAVTGAVTAPNLTYDFSSRANFISWLATATPQSGDIVSVYSGGDAGVIQFVYDGSGTDFTEAALNGWHAVAPVYLEHFGITTVQDKTSEGTVYTAEVQAAMDATEGELLFTGFVKITDKVICPNRCTIKAPKGRVYGGISVFDDFNLSATCVLQPGTAEAGSTIDGLTIWFQQPAAPVNRAALTQYPPALDISSTARGYIKSIRIEQGWDGISGIGNCGGYKFGIIELGCFNQNFEIDGALDFMHAQTIHVWPFGFASNSDLLNVYYDGSTVGLELGEVDNFSCSELSVFRAKIILGRAGQSSTLPYQFHSVALDGDGSSITFNGDSSQIGSLYSTKSNSVTAQDITCAGGRHTIQTVQMVVAADASILCSGGYLSIGGGSVQQVGPIDKRALVVNSTGTLSVSNVSMSWIDSARAVPFVDQAGTTSTLRIANCYADGSYTNNEELIRFNSDQTGNYLFCPDLLPHTANINGAWVLGYYDTGYLTTRVSPDGKAAIQYYRKFSDTNEGWELNFTHARGSSVTPTASASGDIVGDLAWGAHDGTSSNLGAILRTAVTGTVSTGVTPMKMQWFIEDSVGTLGTPMDISGDEMNVRVDMNLTGDFGASGAVTGSNLAVSNWNTAYGWGDHALAGYLSTSGKAADSNLLDGLDSTQFLRSDQSDTIDGVLTVGGTSIGAVEGGQINLTKSTGSTLSGNVAIDQQSQRLRFFEEGGTSRGAYIDLTTCSAGAEGKIWHNGNDGTGSGLDADLLDSLDSTQFLRSDQSDTLTGDLATTGSVTAGSFGSFEGNTGNGSTAYTVKMVTNGAGQGERAGMALYPTFETTGDNSPRRAADIIAGFDGGSWGNEFIALHVGIGTANGAESLTPEKVRINKTGVGIATTSPTNALDVNSNAIRIRTARTPGSAAGTGTQGEISWDANYIYICVATNTWKRVAISTW